MACVSPDFDLRKKHDDAKFVSKDNTSFRLLYYGDVSGAVPFMWETCPGTPKHPQNLITIPPLTPPPSYYATNSGNYSKKKYSRSKLLLHTLLSRIIMNPNNKLNKSHSPSSSFSKSSSSNSWFSDSAGITPVTADPHKPRRFLSWVL